MAAGRAAESGAKVVLIEKNKELGKKILLTGKGRCNITNAEFNLRQLVADYGKGGKFLFHAFSVFGPQDVIDFFAKLGLPTKTERGKRVFPVSDNAGSVISALTKYLTKNKVNIICDAPVIKIVHQNHHIKKLILKDEEITAKNYIFALAENHILQPALRAMASGGWMRWGTTLKNYRQPWCRLKQKKIGSKNCRA